MKTQTYPTDLADRHWDCIKDLVPAAKAGGGPRSLDMRQVMNAILYILVTVAQWRMLPKDYPTWKSVYTASINKLQRLPDYTTLTPGSLAKPVETSFRIGRRVSCQGTELASMPASAHVPSTQLFRTLSRRYPDGNTLLYCRSEPGR